MSDRRRRTAGWSAVLTVVLLVLTGCGAVSTEVTGQAEFVLPANAANATVPIRGTDHGRIDQIVANAITDIQAYWSKEMPLIFHKPYRPVDGGFYSIDPKHAPANLPCDATLRDVTNNAFYCSSGDLVSWDRSGLFATLDNDFGDYAIAMVLAHEWGHAIQQRTTRPGRTIVVETQADCYAGAFTASAYAGHAAHFHIGPEQLDQALAGYLGFADPVGETANGPRAHGDAFDRIGAFGEGFSSGAAYCASAKNFGDNRTFTELPFTSQREEETGGNLPLAQALADGGKDLADYWRADFGKLDPSGHWSAPKVIDYQGDHARQPCDRQTVSRVVLFCRSSDSIYLQTTPGLDRLYSSDGLHDYGVVTLEAIAYGYAVRDQQHLGITGTGALLGAICLAGAYTRDALANTAAYIGGSSAAHLPRPDAQIFLSAGDLDEAMRTTLIGIKSAAFDSARDTTGFSRADAFEQGVRVGLSACGRY